LCSRILPSLKQTHHNREPTYHHGTAAQERLCEDVGPIVAALLGENKQKAIEAAIREDGRAHFLAGYDGKEIIDPDGILRYRTN
jgi:hypothetical protein